MECWVTIGRQRRFARSTERNWFPTTKSRAPHIRASAPASRLTFDRRQNSARVRGPPIQHRHPAHAARQHGRRAARRQGSRHRRAVRSPVARIRRGYRTSRSLTSIQPSGFGRGPSRRYPGSRRTEPARTGFVACGWVGTRRARSAGQAPAPSPVWARRPGSEQESVAARCRTRATTSRSPPTLTSHVRHPPRQQKADVLWPDGHCGVTPTPAKHIRLSSKPSNNLYVKYMIYIVVNPGAKEADANVRERDEGPHHPAS